MTREIWESVKEQFVSDYSGVTDEVEDMMKEKKFAQEMADWAKDMADVAKDVTDAANAIDEAATALESQMTKALVAVKANSLHLIITIKSQVDQVFAVRSNMSCRVTVLKANFSSLINRMKKNVRQLYQKHRSS